MESVGIGWKRYRKGGENVCVWGGVHKVRSRSVLQSSF